MLSRWPVLLEHQVASDDVDGDGRLTEAACERLFAEGRAAFFSLCRTFDAEHVEVVESASPSRRAPAGETVTVSVAVTEVFPDRFTMTGRIRPVGVDGVAADVRCTVSAGPVTDEVRDDLIAIAHAAEHWH